MRLHCFKPHSAVGFMRARLPTMDCAAQSPTPHSLRTCAGYPCCIMRFALQICCNIYMLATPMLRTRLMKDMVNHRTG